MFPITTLSWGVFIWRRASPLCRDPASQLNSLTKFLFVYMRGGPALLGGISQLTTEISQRTALLGGLANQSSVHTTKFVLASIFFLDNFSVYKFCLFRFLFQVEPSIIYIYTIKTEHYFNFIVYIYIKRMLNL